MKRKLITTIYLIATIMLITACSTKEVKTEYKDKEVISDDSKGKVYDANGNLLSEIIGRIDGKIDKYVYVYYKTNQLKSKTRYLDNIKHGPANTYYENGNIYQEDIYKDGKQDGLQKAYYKNGNVQYTAYMMNDKFYGFSKVYYSNTNKKSIANYNLHEQIIYLKTYRIY